MELCPYCKERVSLHVGKYRCSRCHIWLERGECLEVEHTISSLPSMLRLIMTQDTQEKSILCPVISASNEIT